MRPPKPIDSALGPEPVERAMSKLEIEQGSGRGKLTSVSSGLRKCGLPTNEVCQESRHDPFCIPPSASLQTYKNLVRDARAAGVKP
jgi:hypothetical protein